MCWIAGDRRTCLIVRGAGSATPPAPTALEPRRDAPTEVIDQAACRRRSQRQREQHATHRALGRDLTRGKSFSMGAQVALLKRRYPPMAAHRRRIRGTRPEAFACPGRVPARPPVADLIRRDYAAAVVDPLVGGLFLTGRVVMIAETRGGGLAGAPVRIT